jgi:Flp pilus assembly protein protease CpaA
VITTPTSPAGTRRRLWLAAVVIPVLLAQPWPLVAGAAGLTAPWNTVTGLVLGLALLTATATDLAYRRIYNWCTYSAGAWAAALQLTVALTGDRTVSTATAGPSSVAAWIGGPTPTDAFFGLLVGFGVTFALYTVFRGGAGDVKLVAVIGALTGPTIVLQALVYAYLFAGIAALAYLVWTAGPVALLARTWTALGLPANDAIRARAADAQAATRCRMPMGPFHAAGAVLALSWLPNTLG